MLSGSVLFSSCIGSFGLWNSLKDWNQGKQQVCQRTYLSRFPYCPCLWNCLSGRRIGFKFHRILERFQPYSFYRWSKNSARRKWRILGKNQRKRLYHYQKGEDKSVDLVYNKENNTWNAVADGQSFELVKMNEDGTAVLSLQNGTSMTVTPDAQGIATARIATGNSLFLLQDNKHNII